MSDVPCVNRAPAWRRWLPAFVVLLACAAGVGWAYLASQPSPATAGVRQFSDEVPEAAQPGTQPVAQTKHEPAKPKEEKAEPKEKTYPAPELEGGLEWLNTGGPIRMKDLRGKIVLLDFWTYCCINCIHVMPDLAKLEKKYPNQLVVIGVHSAKFETE